MAQEKNADQTEHPTPKKLKDAREKGEVHRSQDLTKTVLILFWLAMLWLLGSYLLAHAQAIMQLVLQDVGHTDNALLLTDLHAAAWLFVGAVAPFLVFAAAMAALVEFLQVGPLLAFERIKPKLDRVNPGQGLKRLFSQENMVEVAKAIFKTGALIGIVVLVGGATLDQYFALPLAPPGDILMVHWHAVKWVGIWIVFVFFFVSVLDALYQRFAFIKNLKMSRRDIRQEYKDTEGDPQMKGQRKELHKEWSQQNMLAAVRGATAVVTNPTHIAVALLYVPDKTDLPVVVAKGEDYEARLIREAAEEANVPVMRNVKLARGLHEKIEVDHYISSEFFEAVAEVLRWVETVGRKR